MEIKQIKELMAAMGRTGTKRLTLKREGFELQLEREENGSQKALDTFTDSGDEFITKSENALQRASIALAKGKDLTPTPAAPLSGNETQEEVAGVFVTSPMVGTFYSSPTPDEPAFVKVGDKIEKHTVVCIIEAMKVMNEVKAGVAGTVAEILMENGHPIEFGTKLFRIV